MPRQKKSTALDQSGAHDAIMYRPIPDYLRKLQNTAVRKHKDKDWWFVYDVRKHLPVLFAPVFKVVRSNSSVRVIDIVTNETVFRTNQIGLALKYADGNLPKR